MEGDKKNPNPHATPKMGELSGNSGLSSSRGHGLISSHHTRISLFSRHTPRMTDKFPLEAGSILLGVSQCGGSASEAAVEASAPRACITFLKVE